MRVVGAAPLPVFAYEGITDLLCAPILMPLLAAFLVLVVSEWAMLGSNQRPLPCEGSTTMSLLFFGIQKYLQMSIFSLADYRKGSHCWFRLLHIKCSSCL